MYTDELRHYGILGMKWGVRRTEQQLTKAKGRVNELEEKLARKTGSKTPSQNTKPVKKKLSEMTDDELRAKLNRLQMEKQVRELSGKESTKKGESAVREILASSAKNIAKQATTYAMGRLVNAMFSKAAGENIVNPKKGQKD